MPFLWTSFFWYLAALGAVSILAFFIYLITTLITGDFTKAGMWAVMIASCIVYTYLTFSTRLADKKVNK